MNEMKLLRAFGGISDEHILEACCTKRKRISKKIIVPMIAAAVLAFGAIGAGAYAYNRGLWNGIKYYYTEEGEEPVTEVSESKAAAIESMTVFDGTFLYNTFDGLDVTFEGSVPDVNSDGSGMAYNIFTIRKSDGTPFDEPPEGWRYVIKYGEFAYGRNDGFPLYKDSSYRTDMNDDGSITVTLSSWTAGAVLSAIYDKGKYPVYLGFTDLYLEPNWTEGDEPTEINEKLGNIVELGQETEGAFMTACNGSQYFVEDEDCLEVYWTEDPMGEDCELVRAFKEKDVELSKAHEEIAKIVYHGSVLYSVDFSNYEQKALKFEVECNGKAVNIEISPLKAWLSGEGCDSPFGADKPQLILNYKDGETVELEFGECNSWGWGSPDEFHDFWNIIGKAKEPIDIENVESIVFEGTTISVEK